MAITKKKNLFIILSCKYLLLYIIIKNHLIDLRTSFAFKVRNFNLNNNIFSKCAHLEKNVFFYLFFMK